MQIKEKREIEIPLHVIMAPVFESLKRDYGFEATEAFIYDPLTCFDNECVTIRPDTKDETTVTFIGTKTVLISPSKLTTAIGDATRNITLNL